MQLVTHWDVSDGGSFGDISNATDKALKLIMSSVSLGVDSKINLWNEALVVNSEIIMADDCLLDIGYGTRLRGVKIAMYNPGTTLKIGQKCVLNHGARIHCENSIEIGNYNLIAPGTYITDSQIHSLDPDIRSREIQNYIKYSFNIPRVRSVPLVIGDKCWFGIYSQIQIAKEGIDRMVIADGTIVGGGAVVKDPVLEPYKKIAGVPAKIIGDAPPNFTKEELLKMNLSYRG